MGRLWAVIKREYLERVRTKWFFFATFFAPVLFSGITLLPMWLAAKSARPSDVSQITVLDASGLGMGERVKAALATGGVLGDSAKTQVIVLDTTQLAAAESATVRAVMKRETRGYLVLGPRILQDTTTRYAGRNASSLVDVGRIAAAVRQAILTRRLEQEGFDAARVTRVTGARRIELLPEQIGDRGREGSGGIVKYIFAFTLGFLLYMSIFLYGQAVMRGVLEEKQTRVAEIVVSSVKPDTLLAGKVIGVGAVGLTQQLMWVVTTLLIVQLRAPIMRALGIMNPSFSMPSISPGVLALLLTFFVLGFLLYSALFAAVGAMVNDDRDAQQAMQPVTLLLVATIILIQPVLINPTTPLARWASMFPFSAPVLMPVRMSLTAVPWQEVAGAIAVMLVMIAIAIWFASRIYRVGLLMYGKRPTIRELARWVRRSA